MLRHVFAAFCLLTMTALCACSPAGTPNATGPGTTSTGSSPTGTTSTGMSPNGSSASAGTTVTGSAAAQLSDATTKGPNVPACSLVTRQQAESYMGEFQTDPQPLPPQTNEIACLYGPNGNGNSATVRVYGIGQWLLQRTIYGEETIIPYELGDSAFYLLKDANTDLWARKGDWVVNVKGDIGIITATQFVEAAFAKLSPFKADVRASKSFN